MKPPVAQSAGAGLVAETKVFTVKKLLHFCQEDCGDINKSVWSGQQDFYLHDKMTQIQMLHLSLNVIICKLR